MSFPSHRVFDGLVTLATGQETLVTVGARAIHDARLLWPNKLVDCLFATGCCKRRRIVLLLLGGKKKTSMEEAAAAAACHC